MIRSAVEYRDKGICAACGEQCRLRHFKFTGTWGSEEYYAKRTENIKRRNWEADHIKPVSEGGGLCGVEGYRTLCSECHKVESKKLAARLAMNKRVKKESLFANVEGE